MSGSSGYGVVVVGGSITGLSTVRALAHHGIPVAVLSGLETVNTGGKVIETYLLPTLPRGSHFGLEEIDPGQSVFSKATLFVEREVLLGIGGFDESNSTLQYTEMFLRLNPVCSILGLPVVTYRQLIHDGSRLSRDPSRRQLDFDRLMSKHESFFNAHPKMFAAFVLRQAHALCNFGEFRGAFVSVCKALQLDPFHTLTRIASLVRRRVHSRRAHLCAGLIGAQSSALPALAAVFVAARAIKP